MEKKRSKGVVIFGILISLYGFFGSIGCFQSILEEKLNIYLTISILFFIIFLISGIGVLMLKQWARTLLLYTIIPGLAFEGLVTAFIEMPSQLKEIGLEMENYAKQSMMPGQTFAVLGILAWGFVVIYFFTRPNVKEQFR